MSVSKTLTEGWSNSAHKWRGSVSSLAEPGESLLFGLLGALLLLMICSGCSSHPKNPFSTGDQNQNDTTQNPNDSAQYGSLYFATNSSTPWIKTGTVRVENGVILVDNQTSDTIRCSCRLDSMVNFGTAITLAFLWQGGAASGAEYDFMISSDGTNWDRVPYASNGSGWMAGRFFFLMNQTEPVTFRFDFTMPPGGVARIVQVRGYGKGG